MTEIVKFDACASCFYALRANGEVIAWGKNGVVPDVADYRQMPADMGAVKDILCMPETVFAIDENNIVRGWGLNKGGLLDIESGLKAKALFSNTSTSVVCILMDDTLKAWGTDSGAIANLPAGLKAKTVKLYDDYGLIIDLNDKVVSWGNLPAGIVFPPTLIGLKSIESAHNTVIFIKDNGYPGSLKGTAFQGVPVFPPSLNNSPVSFLDGFNNYYGMVSKNKLYCWGFTDADGIKDLSKPLSKVSSCRIKVVGEYLVYCVIHKTGLVSIVGGSASDRKIPASIAHYSAQSSLAVLLVNPSAPVVAAAEVAPNAVASPNFASKPINIVNPGAADKPIRIKSLRLGSSHAAVLTEEGKVICWGTLNPASLQALEGVKEMFCGEKSIHIISSAGDVEYWAGDQKTSLLAKAYLLYNDSENNSIFADTKSNQLIFYTGAGNLVTEHNGGSMRFKKIQRNIHFTTALTYQNKLKVFNKPEDVGATAAIPEDLQDEEFSDFSSGLTSTIAIDLDGKLHGWASSIFPHNVLPEGLKHGLFITSSANRHAVIKRDETLVVWSYNDDGSILIDNSIPKNLKVRSVSLTDDACGLITKSGKVVIISTNESLKAVPDAISGNLDQDASWFLPLLPEAATVSQLAPGYGFTIALKKDSSIIGWGSKERSVLNIPAISAKFVCAGDGVAGAIKQDNTFVSWGENASEELAGRKLKKVILHKSGLALGLSGEVIVFGLSAADAARYVVPDGLSAKDIAFLEYDDKKRYAALKDDNSVVCWGDDAVPVTESALKITMGKKAIIIVKSDGKVMGFGSNEFKELDAPSKLKAREIYAGDMCYGMVSYNNSFGNWGLKAEDSASYKRTEIWQSKSQAFAGKDTGVCHLAYTGYHVAAVNSDGHIVLWGPNDNNECVLPDILCCVCNPINMGGFVTGIALTNNFGSIIVDGVVKVWGGLNKTPEQRNANLAPADRGYLQVASAGNAWFGILDTGRISSWNYANGLESGTSETLASIVNNDKFYEKISCSKDIILGISYGSGKVVGFGKKGWAIQKIPESCRAGVKDIFAGPTCAMAIDSEDKLVIWGKKYDACLNPPADLGPIKSVLCTSFYGLAIKADGELRLWGGLSPAALAAATRRLPAGKFKQITNYEEHYLAIREDDTVVEWGGENLVKDFVMPPDLKASLIATSGVSGFSAAVNLSGELVVWGGSLAVGQNDPLANIVTRGGADVEAEVKPVAKTYVPKKNESVQTVVKSETKALVVASGAKNIGIVNESGQVVIWGSKEHKLYFIPRHLLGVDALYMGPTSCIARNSVGQYIYWGKVEPETYLDLLPDTLDAKKIVLTEFTGLAINEDDSLLKWGKIPGLRDGHDFSDLPSDLKQARDIAAFEFNYIAADIEGQIYYWGPDFSSKYDSSKKAIAVSAGKRHFAAILEDNTVISWGKSNEYKQQDVPAGLKAKKIECGHHYTVAIDMNDNVVAWGFPNACSQVPAGQKAVSVACGPKHVIALQEDGFYVIWAHNIYNTARQAPTEVFIDPSETLAEVAYKFRDDFVVPTKYTLNIKQLKSVVRNDVVFDMIMHNPKRKLFDFLLEHQGNAVFFRYNGVQSATLKSEIEKGFKEGGEYKRLNVFYECTKMFPFDPDHGQFGTFEYKDIYKKPYYQLNLGNGSFLITMDDLERIFKQNQFWILQDTGIELKNTASYWSVVAGGPLISSNHCQEGTDKKVFMLIPFSIISEEEEDDEEAVPQDIIKVKFGEETTEIDIRDSKKVADVKAKYAALKGIKIEELKFISAGKVLTDEQNVVPGFVIQVMKVAVGGSFKRLSNTRKNLKRS